MRERQWKMSILWFRRRREPLSHKWGHEKRVNEWVIINHYPSPISDLFRCTRLRRTYWRPIFAGVGTPNSLDWLPICTCLMLERKLHMNPKKGTPHQSIDLGVFWDRLFQCGRMGLILSIFNTNPSLVEYFLPETFKPSINIFLWSHSFGTHHLTWGLLKVTTS